VRRLRLPVELRPAVGAAVAAFTLLAFGTINFVAFFGIIVVGFGGTIGAVYGSRRRQEDERSEPE